MARITENPAITSVSINKDYFQTISVEIKEQEKEAIYCTSFENTDCFYVNPDGFIYAQVDDFFVPEQEILFYREVDQKKIGELVYEETLHTSLMTFIKSAARYDFRIMYAYVRSDDVVELYTKEGARLLASRYDDFEKDFINFIALFDQNILTKESLSEIDYIDLRFGNKVFYKNKSN